MELIPYPGLEKLPRKFWKRVYTAEEKQVIKERYRFYYLKSKEARPVRVKPPPTSPVIKRAKALENAAFQSAGFAAVACLTKEDRNEILKIYIRSVELSDSGIRHSVDHIYPIGGKKYGVCGLHVVANLVVMPLEENQSKNNRPHHSWTDYVAIDEHRGICSTGND